MYQRAQVMLDDPQAATQANPIRRVFLQPEHPPVYPEVVRALLDADLIVLGPGSLFTSILPNLLVAGVCEAIADSDAEVVYLVNLMTKHGETDGYAASDFIRTIHRYLGAPVDCAVLNYHESLPRELYEKYKSEQAEPVAIDLARCYELVEQLAIRPLTATGALVRHDPTKLAGTLLEVAKGASRAHATVLPAAE